MATQPKQASALEAAAVAAETAATTAETTAETAAQTAAVSAPAVPAANLVLAKEGSVPPSAGSWRWVSDGTTQGTGWLRL